MANRKIHLRVNKLTGENTARAICASKSIGNGQSVLNDRRSYSFMASEIVGQEEFRATPLADRCAHCLQAGLAKKNAQRALNGKPPTDIF